METTCGDPLFRPPSAIGGVFFLVLAALSGAVASVRTGTMTPVCLGRWLWSAWAVGIGSPRRGGFALMTNTLAVGRRRVLTRETLAIAQGRMVAGFVTRVCA